MSSLAREIIAWCRRERRRAHSARYRAAHREEFRLYTRTWYAKNAARKVAAVLVWRDQNRDRHRAACARYAAAHPEKVRAKCRAAQARLRAKRKAAKS